MHTQGIQLITPAMPPKRYKQGQITLEQFELNASGAIIACSQGHSPDGSSVSNTKIEMRFDLITCKNCPLHEKCPGYQRSQSGKRWQYTPHGFPLALAFWQINSRNLRNAIGGELGLRE